MPKKDMVACLKRVANVVWKENGVIRRIDYMGHNKLPFAKYSASEDMRYHEGSYFLYHFSLGNSKIKNLRPEFKLEVDLLNASVQLTDESKIPDDYGCTLEEELLPPVFRKSVKPLLDDKNVLAETRR